MDYKMKYKEAFERAKGLLDGMDEGDYFASKEDIENIFPELKESEDERIKREIVAYINELADLKNEKIPTKWLNWLEKRGEQKSADNVEPKFHEGDWILNNVCFPMQIASIKDSMYIFIEGDALSVSFVDEHFHLWTIADAKVGDVLVNWNNTTFIFKAIEDKTVKFHIAYNEEWDTIKTPSTKLSHLGLPEPQFEFHPATKEQCDILFQQMKEAGYEWDADKKEMKKMEVASKENEDERMRKAIIDFLKNIEEENESSLIFGKTTTTDMIAWLEKQKKD